MKLHKTILAVIIFSALYFAAAGNAVCQRITTGLIGGYSSVGLSGDTPDDAGYTGSSGYVVGADFEVGITNDIKIILQPNYSVFGTAIGYDVGAQDLYDSLKLSMSYFRIPLLVKFEALNDVTFFSTGLDLGILSDAKLETVNYASNEADVKDAFESIDLSAVFSAGFSIPVSVFRAGLEARYMQSLINISSGRPINQSDIGSPRLRFAGLQFLAGITYNF